jgi:tetratricopeptide (TPR) repeat protein
MFSNIDRAILLLHQGRHELAERELRAVLSNDPDDPLAHAFLALCLAERKEFRDANGEVARAIRLAPDLDFVHYVNARILLDQKFYDRADKAIDEAIRLDPDDADYHWIKGAIHCEHRRWAEALEAAERGLKSDAEHVPCTNLRAMALVKLNRRAEAGATLEGALAKAPENAYTHANRGWALLEQGDRNKAMEHFREALRLDPTMEWARIGIVEALKAKHLVYRLMLRYFLWSAKASQQAQFALLAAILFGPRLLGNLARGYPTLAPLFQALALGIIAFAVMTWIADPLFNLLLRINRFGRLALSREQTVASNWLGLCFLGIFASVPAWLVTRDLDVTLAILLTSGLLLLPVSAVFKCRAGWPRWVMSGLAVAMLLAGLTLTVSLTPAGSRLAARLVSPPAPVKAPLDFELERLKSKEPRRKPSPAAKEVAAEVNRHQIKLLEFLLYGAVGSTWLAAAFRTLR